MIDAFLELKDFAGKLVEGESHDAAFPKRIEIHEFSLGYGRAAGEDDPTDEAAKDAKSAEKEMTGLVKMWEKLKEKVKETEEKKAVTTALDKAGDVQSLIGKLQKDLDEVQAKKKKKAGTEPAPEPTPAPTPAKKADKAADQLTFSIGKDFDTASPDLFQAYCWTQSPREAREKHKQLGRFQSANVYVRKMLDGKPEPYLICSFREVEVYDYSLKFDSGRNGLAEDVTFKFIDYRVWYRAQNDDGSKGPDTSIEGTTAQSKGK